MSFFNTISKNDVVFLTPLIVATAPLSLLYILLCKTQGRSVIHVFLYSPMCFLYNNIKHSHLLPLYCCVTRQGERLRFDFVAIAVFQPLCFFNPSVLRTPPLYFCVAKTQRRSVGFISSFYPLFSLLFFPCRFPWYYGQLRQWYRGDTAEMVVSAERG